MKKINRRKAMGIVARWSAGAFLPLSGLLDACSTTESTLFSREYQSLLGEMVEIILPKTATSPGAKEADVHRFVAVIAEECYEIADKERLVAGLKKLLTDGFLQRSPQAQYEVVLALDQEVNALPADTPHFFRDLKSLTRWGYFTSEAGVTKALRYNPIPGSYKGCVPYEPGEIAWY